MIIDAVLARSEAALIDFRCKVFRGYVDRIVIGESPVTFSGEARELFFHPKFLAGALPSLVEVVVLEVPQAIVNARDTVLIQDEIRAAFVTVVTELFPEAFVIYEDVDEFPSPSQLEALRQRSPKDEVLTVPMTMTSRRANWEIQRKRRGWRSVKAVRGPTKIRNLRSHPVADEVPGEPGIHLSYLGMDVNFLREKFRQYGHQEFNVPSIWTEEYMNFCDRFGVDHLGLADARGFGLLKRTPDSMLGEIAQEAMSLEPNWKGGPFSGSRLYRIACAQIALVYVRSHGARRFFTPGGERPTARGVVYGLGLFLVTVMRQRLQSLRDWIVRPSRRLGRLLRSFRP